MIKIEKDKILFSDYGFKEKKIKSEEIFYYLNNEISFGNDVTFERFFNILIENKDLVNIIFSGHMGGYKIDDYIEDFNAPSRKKDNDWFSGVSHCEVFITFDHIKYKDDSEDMSLYYGFHGVGNDKNKTNYGFMGSKLCDIKHLPIKVNNYVEFVIDTGKSLHGKNSVSFKEKYKTIHKGELSINVFNFIGAVLHEITWFGTPEDRDREFQHIIDIADRIDRGEEELFEMKWDDDGNPYLIDNDGNKRPFLDFDNNDK